MIVVSPGSGQPIDIGNAERLGPARLERLVRLVAAAGNWRELVMFDSARRWYRRLEQTGNYEIWLLAWLPGQHTGFHDHGDAAGAFAVVQGQLRESLARPGSRRVRPRTAGPGTVTSFGARHLHDVGNASAAPAVSIHAYSPPLTAMRRYDMTASGLMLARTDRAGPDW
jgi:predicted metal-dependent enzyme (double-stranded beta helix superfamily)